MRRHALGATAKIQETVKVKVKVKAKVTRKVWLLAFAFGTVSCGDSVLNDAESCQFDVFTSNIATQAANKRIELSGELPTPCETLTQNNTGKLVVEVRLVGQEDINVVLSQVQAGKRTKNFDPVAANLKVGSIDAAFSSVSEPTWTVPWSDAPNSFLVAVEAPLQRANSSLPQKASVRLSL